MPTSWRVALALGAAAILVVIPLLPVNPATRLILYPVVVAAAWAGAFIYNKKGHRVAPRPRSLNLNASVPARLRFLIPSVTSMFGIVLICLGAGAVGFGFLFGGILTGLAYLRMSRRAS